MKKSKILFGFAVCFLALTSCSNTENDDYQPHVYIVGGNVDIFNTVLWTDNNVTLLPTVSGLDFSNGDFEKSHLNSLFVADGNVYIVGYDYDNDNFGDYHASLWKNGEETTLSQMRSSAYSVFAHGQVYVAGYEQNSSNRNFATLWIDSIATRLSNKESVAFGVYVSRGKTYVVGRIESTNGNYNAVLWVNGLKTVLSSQTSVAYSVFVKNDNVYVAGVENGNATLWVNNAATTLSNDYSSARSVFVANNNKVYVAGENQNSATLWEDGIPATLDASTSIANSVFVSGNNVYAAGMTMEMLNHNCGYPTLWRNGNKDILSTEGVTRFIDGGALFYASGIFVK